jgi:hypothetical protein
MSLMSEICECGHTMHRHAGREGACTRCPCDALTLVPARKAYKYQVHQGESVHMVCTRYPRGRVCALEELSRPARERRYRSV